ncbi:MAG TPA: enolase C-terminal domain-like protein [Streptosporangiaceae bacterium]|nr:enolase C-terminal domain-like protein [Streptosporangiaceae bacterium]
MADSVTGPAASPASPGPPATAWPPAGFSRPVPPVPPASTTPAIEELAAAVYVIPTDAPEADGTLAWSQTTLVLVTARAGGQQGIGWTYAAAAAASVVTDVLAGVATGHSALDVPAAAEAMARSLRNIGRRGVAAMALSAADIALWDLKARLLGLPLASLLGQARASVPVYGSGGFTSYDDQQTRDQLAGWVSGEGIPRVKIKIGESRGAEELRDLSRVALARSVIGPGTELYVDANGGYRASQAIRVARQLADHGVTWFEEPVSSDDLAGLAAIRQQVTPDVAAGEYSFTLADSAALIGAGAVDCLQLDVTRCGGITEFLRSAALAAAHNLEVSAHCAPGLHAPVGTAIPNLRHLEYFHDHQRIEHLLFDGTLSPRGGALTPDPAAPGLGLTLRQADAERFRRR